MASQSDRDILVVGMSQAEDRRTYTLAILIFVQMLPATLLTPAVRPLFAALHGGAEGPMHAFMSLNMLGAAVAAPCIGALADRRADRGRILAGLAGLDALLLVLLPLPLPSVAVLALRTLEGGAHVGSATLLIAEMAARGARGGRTMGLAGAAIMAAVAAGGALGGVLLVFGVGAPFRGAALLAAAVAIAGPRQFVSEAEPHARVPLREIVRMARSLAVPLGAVFASRFSVGCLIVTFALLAHARHGLDDTTVGILYSTLTVPFALATYPAARLGARVPPALLLGGGAVVWGASLAALGWAPTWALFPTMAIAGLASAAMFAPILVYAAALPGGRATAMAMVNAAGSLGMLLGPAAAGITIEVLKRTRPAAEAYRGPFPLAAAAVALWLVLALPWIVREARAFKS